MPAKKKNEKRNNSQQKNKKANLKKINYNVFGIDLSSEEMFIVIVDKGVRSFSTFTRGLEEASCYLKLEGIEKIVMEATGIYWIPVYEHFEKEITERNIFLVLARHYKCGNNISLCKNIATKK